jgi:acetaldehyde dehydrogenase (acetylating)
MMAIVPSPNVQNTSTHPELPVVCCTGQATVMTADSAAAIIAAEHVRLGAMVSAASQLQEARRG